MAKSKSASMGLAMQMLIGLVLGVIVGMFLDSQFAATYVKPFGDLFIRLIRMVVVPLVFATLVAGAAGISDVSKLGRVAVKTLLIFMITSAISVIFGLVIANIIDPGIGLTLSTEGLKAAQVKAPSFIQTLLDIVPINPMEAFSKGSILQIIFFAIMFGFCLNFLGEKGSCDALCSDRCVRFDGCRRFSTRFGCFAPVGQVDSVVVHRYGFVDHRDLHPDRDVHHSYSARSILQGHL